MSSYGIPNAAYVGGWRERTDDRPMWALNLMRYRPHAEYADGRATTLTGREADDLYAPHEALSEVGAASVLRASVTHQLAGDGARWDRVAVARYPKRCAMLDMQRLPSFQRQHVHKVAGMEFTIVLATFPAAEPPPAPDAARYPMMLLQVVCDRAAPDWGAGLDAAPIGVFDVEDVIIGDERRYAQARWHAISRDTADVLLGRPRTEDAGSYVLILERERGDLVASLR